MKKLLIACLMLSASAVSLAKLPPLSDEAKAKADRREQVRAYEEGAPTGFSHDSEVLRKGFMSLIFKHITDETHLYVHANFYQQAVSLQLPQHVVLHELADLQI